MILRDSLPAFLSLRRTISRQVARFVGVMFLASLEMGRLLIGYRILVGGTVRLFVVRNLLLVSERHSYSRVGLVQDVRRCLALVSFLGAVLFAKRRRL